MLCDRIRLLLLNREVERFWNGDRERFVYNNGHRDFHGVGHVLDELYRIWDWHWDMYMHDLLGHDGLVVGHFGPKACLTALLYMHNTLFLS
jgi:hypothetical protein